MFFSAVELSLLLELELLVLKLLDVVDVLLVELELDEAVVKLLFCR